MTTTCLISNYNYSSYVSDAIDGALRQSVPFDQIIVVDDGSTDSSIELLTSKYGNHRLVQIVGKNHEGQLSCFNEGFARATGDIMFFLDADDIYEPNYVEQALNVYRGHPNCDFLACGRRLFGQQDVLSLQSPTDRDLGYSVILTAFMREWIGASTSCLSVRRQVLSKILPLPFVDGWRTRADDCLVFGASLAGARKRYLAQPLVQYRVHAKNHFCGHASDQSAIYCRRLAVNQLFEHLERKLCFNAARLAEFHHREFCTIESPTFGQLANYVRIGRTARISPFRRLACTVAMIRHFLRGAQRSDSTVQKSMSLSLVHDLTSLPASSEFMDSSNNPDAWRQRRAA